jgi:hypothetical protein
VLLDIAPHKAECVEVWPRSSTVLAAPC